MLSPRLQLKVAQKQILTPGLVQMVTILQVPRLELKEMILQEIAENPVLEETSEAGEELTPGGSGLSRNRGAGLRSRGQEYFGNRERRQHGCRTWHPLRRTGPGFRVSGSGGVRVAGRQCGGRCGCRRSGSGRSQAG